MLTAYRKPAGQHGSAVKAPIEAGSAEAVARILGAQGVMALRLPVPGGGTGPPYCRVPGAPLPEDQHERRAHEVTATITIRGLPRDGDGPPEPAVAEALEEAALALVAAHMRSNGVEVDHPLSAPASPEAIAAMNDALAAPDLRLLVVDGVQRRGADKFTLGFADPIAAQLVYGSAEAGGMRIN
jgi:hypothetical protein